MPSEIFLMILAFVSGAVIQLIAGKKKYYHHTKPLRMVLHHIVVVYLLFKIGFTGGGSILSESADHVLWSSVFAIGASIVWTLALLQLFKITSVFDRLTQISLATHFGSVSVGTFIAGREFLLALGVEVSSNVVIWLAVMELPALFVGVLALGIPFSRILEVLKKDTLLWVLISALLWGAFAPQSIPMGVQEFLFSVLFLPFLAYFLFEMGDKASSSLKNVQGNIYFLLAFGIGIPLVGGILGVFLAVLLQYSAGESFMFSILMASASYVLVPISLKEIFKKSGFTTPQKAENAISSSMALSVGITLPFNILIGFELYYWCITMMI